MELDLASGVEAVEGLALLGERPVVFGGCEGELGEGAEAVV